MLVQLLESRILAKGDPATRKAGISIPGVDTHAECIKEYHACLQFEAEEAKGKEEGARGDVIVSHSLWERGADIGFWDGEDIKQW